MFVILYVEVDICYFQIQSGRVRVTSLETFAQIFSKNYDIVKRETT